MSPSANDTGVALPLGTEGRVLGLLYLFAGKARSGDIAAELQLLYPEFQIVLEEYDVLRGGPPA